MTKTKWLVVALLAVLALGLVLAGCGGTTTTTTAAPVTTAPPATTATTAPPSSETTAPPSSETTASSVVAPTETLKVGVVLQLSDWYSAVDAAEKNDVEYVAKMINDAGGIQVNGKGYKVELVEEDGKSSMDGNTSAATKLVMDDKVQFVLGPAGPFNVATTPIFEQAKVLHVASYNALQPGEMDATTTYEFLGLDPITQHDGDLKALLKAYPNVKKITIASEDSTWPGFKDAFLGLVTSNGLTLAGDPILFATNAEDYNPIAAKIKAQNADAVWMPVGIDPSFAGIVKGARTLGFKGPFTFPTDAPQMIGLLGQEAATDLVCVMTKSLDDPSMTASLPMTALLKEGDPHRQIFGLAPDGLIMLAYVLGQANSLDPTAVRDKWQTLTTVPTLFGPGFPTGAKTYGMTNHAWGYDLPWVLVQNSKIQFEPWIHPTPAP
jgi:branched-chain amino acid transport system substrate-binding protein